MSSDLDRRIISVAGRTLVETVQMERRLAGLFTRLAVVVLDSDQHSKGRSPTPPRERPREF